MPNNTISPHAVSHEQIYTLFTQTWLLTIIMFIVLMCRVLWSEMGRGEEGGGCWTMCTSMCNKVATKVKNKFISEQEKEVI